MVRVRPTTPDDHATLCAIVADESVARWGWAATADDEFAEGFAVVVDGEVHGFVGYDEETDPDYRHVGLDIFLSPAAQGRGIGAAALRQVIDHFAARGHHRFTIDPARDNTRAIRCYERVGFRPVGVLREYERGRDGTFHDGLLMDLLVADLQSL